MQLRRRLDREGFSLPGISRAKESSATWENKQQGVYGFCYTHSPVGFQFSVTRVSVVNRQDHPPRRIDGNRSFVPADPSLGCRILRQCAVVAVLSEAQTRWVGARNGAIIFLGLVIPFVEAVGIGWTSQRGVRCNEGEPAAMIAPACARINLWVAAPAPLANRAAQ
ncbi:hypothetical protein B0I37DRAFT_370362 [Chaetomium sp. MPI-CAGE-AT-0009]|nr:hypothetical protein B0I37DRAFT_370362 [Chaetomium sp. MPI-CAGE-AT-0009]